MTAALALTGEDYAFSRLIAYAAYQWPGYKDAAHHRLIARHLEAVERGEIKRLMITMPPRHGKSMLASEFFPAWYIGRNPDHYVVTATYAQDLADDFGRKVKNQIEDAAFQAVFPGVGLADDSKSAKRFHIDGMGQGGIEHATTQRGAYYAVGVGGPLTGRGAHLLLIDDPVKNREDAESEVMRKKTKDWYTSTAYTRLMPGGRIVIIQCMVGDTQVLMADGTETRLDQVRVGDRVATYHNGKLSTSFVINWAAQGVDTVYEINTICGNTVRANERHPFLVDRDGVLAWVRVRDLRAGDVMMRVAGQQENVKGGAGAPTMRAIGSLMPEAGVAGTTKDESGCTPLGTRASGRVLSAPLMAARNQQALEASAGHTTRKTNGQEGIRHRLPLTQSVGAMSSCGIGMESGLMSTMPCLPSSEAFVPSASAPHPMVLPPIGTAYSASITTMKQAGCEGYFAMTATSSSVEEGASKRSSVLSDIFSVTKDTVASIRQCGREQVYDIQVAGTENFIANGLVSHNTRWHEDDLSGWLQAEHDHEGWVVLNLPAINDNGEALWPEQYSVDELERIKRALPPRDWSALYQQAPSPETGDYFKREWLIPVQTIPPKSEMAIYGGSDYAVTADGGDYTVHAVVGVDHTGRMFLLDLWRQQASSDVWVDAFCALVRKWNPIGWAEETGQIKSGVGPFLIKRMIDSESYTVREQFPTRGDKAVRAQSIRGRMALQGLHVPHDAPWLSDFISELMSFPVGVHDDQVDALGLVGQLMDRIGMGDGPKSDKPKVHGAPVVLEDGVIAPPLKMGRR